MAPRAKKTATDVATVSKGQSIAMVDDLLSKEMAEMKDRIGQATGNSIKAKAAGHFEHPDGRNLGAEIQFIVVDFIRRNNFYSTPFREDNPEPPACYAMNKIIPAMKPEPDSPEPQHENCAGCPQNVFGSAANGSSKACQNRYLLVGLLVDPDNPEAHNEPDAPLYTINLAPTSLKAFDGQAGYVLRMLGGPPIKAVMTAVALEGKYSKVDWVDPVANPDYALHVNRRGEAEDILYRRPDFSQVATAPQSRSRAAPGRRSAARK